jgi:hypothetical protein
MKRRLHVEIPMFLAKYYPGFQIKKNGKGGEMWRVWKRGEVSTGFWWINLEERDHVEDLGLAGSIILKWILNKFVGKP